MTRTKKFLLFLLVVAGVGLRLVGINGQLWFDEIQLLVELVRQPFGMSVAAYTSDNNHPLYSVLAWLSARIFGEAPWSLRLPALLFGGGSLWLLFRLADRVASRSEAWAVTLLMAVSSHHVWFSGNARGYTGLLFFSLAATELFLVVKARPGWRPLALYAASLALGTYVHLTAIYVALAHAIVALPSLCGAARASGLRIGGGLLFAGVLSLLLHAPMLGALWQFFLGWSDAGRVEAVWRSPVWMIEAASASFAVPVAVFAGAAAVAVIAGIAALASLGRRDRTVPFLLVLPAALGFLASVAMQRNLWPRFFFFSAGFGLLILVRAQKLVLDRLIGDAHGAMRSRLFAKSVIVLVVASACLLPSVWFVPKQDFLGARDYIREWRRADEPVLTVGLAIQPYEWLGARDFVPVRSLADLEIRRRDHRGKPWILHTLPIFLEGQDPVLANELRERWTEAHRFRGSVGGGDVIVLRPKE